MKKLFAILMIVTMVVCYMPTVAFADVAGTEVWNRLKCDSCVEQENLDYSTLIDDCDFTFYCTPGGGSIVETYWKQYLPNTNEKFFTMASPGIDGGHAKFKANPNPGWVFSEWKHEISRDEINRWLFKPIPRWVESDYTWKVGLGNDTIRHAFFTPEEAKDTIELRRGPSKGESTLYKMHYVVHAHFNPTITVEYDDKSWSVTDGGNKVANGVQVEVQYKTDKTFGIQTVEGKTAKIEVVDVDGKPVNTGYTKNQDGSITFNKVSQPLKLKVTFEDVELPPAPEEYDASFFFFHADGNEYFPDHSYDDEGKASKGPLLGKVYGVPKTGEEVTDSIKEAPQDADIIAAIKNYYRLTDEEMVGVKWKWNVVKGRGDEGGLECLSCPYHVDGVALDKEGNHLKIKYSMEYLVDGKHHHTARLDEGAENTHAGVPTPTKPGYDFAGWKLVTEGADGTSVSQDLTYEATWTEKPSYDASFFIKPDGVGAPANPNDGFPESGFLPNGDTHKALQGKVYGPATGKDAVKEAIKTEPKREDIINVIREAYQLDEQEEQAVDFRWYVIKSMNDGCEYHVDGVPVLDKGTDNERVLKRYKIKYQDDDGNVLYSTRANAGEDIPGYVGDTPTKDGYKFAGWESSSEDGKVHGHLTLTPKWEDNGNGGNNGDNTGGNGGNNGGNTGGNGGQLPPDQNLEDPDNNGNGGNGNGEGGNGNGGNGGDSQKPLPGDKNLTDGTTDTDVPKTGDAGMDALVLNLLLLSISAMAGTVLYLRRRIAKR